MRVVAVDDEAVYYETDDFDSVRAEYFLDHWGSCSLGGKCVCLKPGNPWLGTACANWTTVGFTNHEEHMRWFKQRS